ncbi:MAG TPA: peptidoglycan-associated lipoprotein Pal [Agitococcus sp.]|nr:peptidoglycan-associated lipoprotein Pal [Agitococcus sp.]HMV61467.1 peptidoglycan-associated lipoprotein Pal [Agitococcus sp.]HMY00712.1 peptidoglycan-associated lipoprotein Pal [Agitococcus sp.]HNC87273.1 peptidoglycan-associated lipoprotein Pal [Agitococcus sp.]HNL80155.1 peptidoglycan-associated lipoprotein Pal [Agitococcus sp.]
MLNSKLSLVLAISLAIGVTGCSTLKKSTTTPTGSEQTSNQSQAEKDKQAAEAQAAALAEQERLKAEALANANKNQGKNANGQNATGQNTDNGSDGNNDSSNQADLLSTRLVHFDYDSSDLNGDDLKILQAHASYLNQNPQAKVLLSGHADERGTREYNMALGERRANAVQAFLNSNGARGGQLDTVSYGKEKPINDGHDEAAWAENRRVEITYKANAPK